MVAFTIFILIGCSKKDEVSGNYLCLVNGKNLDIFIKEDSKATVKYRGKTYAASWEGNTNKINVETNILNKRRQLTLLKTGKFDMDLEIYTLLSPDKEAKDACYKLRNNSEKDLASYKYISTNNRIQNITEKAKRLSALKSDFLIIKSAIMTERQLRLIHGDSTYIHSLSSNDSKLFDRILSYPLTAGTTNGKWEKTGKYEYTFHVDESTNIIFKYDNQNGTFQCIYNCSLIDS